MMNKIIPRLICAAFTVVFLFVSLTACTPSSTTSNTTSETSKTSAQTTKATTKATTSETSLPNINLPSMPKIVRDTPSYLEYMDDLSPITISIFYNRVVADEWTWGENPVEQMITELSGVTLQGSYSADAEGNALTLMLASGDPLPDIITDVGTQSVHMQEMIDSGAIYPLNELIDQYAPGMWDIMWDVVKSYFPDDNGNLWYFPKGYVDPSCADQGYALVNGGFAVRDDIREDLGNPPLNTIDDVWAFLELWKNNQDQWPEIKYPITINPMLTAHDPRPFYNSFGGNIEYDLGLGMEYDTAKDEVYYWVETDAGYDTVKFYYDLAQAGYISQDSFAIASIPDEVQAGSILLFGSGNVWPVGSYKDQLAENVPGARYERILPPMQPGYTQRYIYNPVIWWKSGTVITTDCVDPERTIKFLQFMTTEYVNMSVIAGIYEKDFTLVESPTGILRPKPIGDATDTRKHKELGIYQHQKLWFASYSDYDLINALSMTETQPDIIPVINSVESGILAAAPARAVSFIGGSEEAVLKQQLEEIIGNYVTRCILANDAAEFDAQYNEMLSALKSRGLDDKFKPFVLAETKKFLEKMSNAGFPLK